MARRKSRSQRLKERRVERQTAQRRRQYLWIGGSLLVILVVVGAVVGARARRGPQPGEAVEGMGNLHLQSLDEPHAPYNTSPPTSGPHIELHAERKISTEPVAPEIQVHELEHGGIFINYNCEVYAGDCDALVDELADIVTLHDQVFVAPYADMDTPIALTAWERIDRLDSVDRQRIAAFIEAYVGVNHGG
ncbi:MAG: DUF3105 domain-containing protein [Anaerolineae bacterium]